MCAFPFIDGQQHNKNRMKRVTEKKLFYYFNFNFSRYFINYNDIANTLITILIVLNKFFYVKIMRLKKGEYGNKNFFSLFPLLPISLWYCIIKDINYEREADDMI